MENYIVSARKYRPMTFDSVVGQNALTTTLKNAIAAGKLAHAYLFCGPRGVGKTTCARIFAKTINCLHPNEKGEACDQCESCVAFNEQRSYNIHELDAASNNSVEDIRSLIEQVRIPPQVGRYKVFIIDEVHMLSTAAFNAFLKTLEEPPAHAIFVLATTEKHKILPTILSRCQIFDFNRMEVSDIVGHLRNVAEKEGYVCEEEALNVIARKADGGMRDALSIFDQVASYAGGQITYQKVIEDLNVLDYDYYFQLTDQLLKEDVPGALLTLNEILSKGFEANHFIGGLAAHFRDLLVSRDAATLPLLEVAESVRQKFSEQAQRCPVKFIYRALKLCNDCDINYRTSRNKRLLVELTLIEVAQAVNDDEACGRRPIKKLKPLFQVAASQKAAAAQQPMAATPKAGVAVATSSQPQVAAVQAAPTVAPAAKSAAAPSSSTSASAAATTTNNSLRRRPVSISIHRMGERDQETVAGNTVVRPTTEKVVVLDEKDFEEKDLSYQWYRFANSLPQEQAAVAGRMKNMRPVLQENYHIDVPVENPQVLEYMNALYQHILSFLQTQLRNGKITLQFRLMEQQEEQQRIYSPRERYANMLKKYPALCKLHQTLGLELA